jgi:hypothetical protein
MQSMTPAPPSPEFFKQKAEECVALSYQVADPKGQVAILRLAKWWMQLGECCYAQKTILARDIEVPDRRAG